MDNNKINELIAIHIMGLKPQIDFGKWEEHDWKRDEDGEIDDCAMDIDGHNGPYCIRCNHTYCMHCEDASSEPCEISPPNYVHDNVLPSIAMTKLFDKILRDGYKVKTLFINDNYFCVLDDMINEASAVDKNLSKAMCMAILKVKNIEI